jgi:hypothetical protein
LSEKYYLNDELLKQRVKWEQWNAVKQPVVLQEIDGTVRESLHALCRLLPQFINDAFIKRKEANF